MNDTKPYLIEVHGRKHRFATLAEARAVCDDVMRVDGTILGIQVDD